ncbi:MAG: hypothetical protein WDO74_28500 [Pseudomonadota bacterium]
MVLPGVQPASSSTSTASRWAAIQALPCLPSQLGATSPNYLGRAPDDSCLALYGEVDDLRIYDRALSAPLVALLYKVR